MMIAEESSSGNGDCWAWESRAAQFWLQGIWLDEWSFVFYEEDPIYRKYDLIW